MVFFQRATDLEQLKTMKPSKNLFQNDTLVKIYNHDQDCECLMSEDRHRFEQI